MKILIVGSNHFASYESSCARYFRRAGCDVDIWDNKACFSPFIKKSWWEMNKLMRLMFDMAASVNFITASTKYSPDIIFMPKAENIHHRAVRKAKERTGAKLIVWYPDNPFRAENTSMNILRNLELIDIFYIWGKFLMASLVSAGCRRVEYLPFGFDPELFSLSSPTCEQNILCSHIGSYSQEKRDALAPLAESGLQIWGPGWEHELPTQDPLANCVKGGGLYGKDMTSSYYKSLVIANPIRLQNMPAHNLRTMEAAGIGGGVVLTQRTEEQAKKLFAEDEHILCYETPEEMREKVLWAKNHRDKIKEMANQAREHVFASHLLEHRIQQILSDINF